MMYLVVVMDADLGGDGGSSPPGYGGFNSHAPPLISVHYLDKEML
jgi:hypothetical protein